VATPVATEVSIKVLILQYESFAELSHAAAVVVNGCDVLRLGARSTLMTVDACCKQRRPIMITVPTPPTA